MVASGQDCCLQFPDAGYDELRLATVDGAMAASGSDGTPLRGQFLALHTSRPVGMHLVQSNAGSVLVLAMLVAPYP
jgi:hypothetical protein